MSWVDLIQFEDDAGTCNTCPGELEPAECLQRDPVRRPPPVPWRELGAGLAVVLAVLLGVHVFCVVTQPSVSVAAK